jgi:hypothetical protein
MPTTTGCVGAPPGWWAWRQGSRGGGQVLTQRLLAARGVAVSLEAVTEKFEELYQGTETVPGLCERERLIVPKVGNCNKGRGLVDPDSAALD